MAVDDDAFFEEVHFAISIILDTNETFDINIVFNFYKMPSIIMFEESRRG